MKNFKNYLSFLAVFALLFTSCSKDEAGMQDETPENVASLTFASVLADFNKSNAKQMDDYPDCADASVEPTHAAISLVYGDANIPVNVQVNISEDGNGFFTVYDEDLEIPVPNDEDWVDVTLLDFDVYSGTTLLWSAPHDGSEFGEFVADALPMDFQLRAGSKNYVDVEVLCFDNRVVNRYGYQFFNIIPEELRQLCFFVNYCSDEGRHYTADYDLRVFYYTGDDTEDVAWEDLDLIFSDSPAALTDGGAFYTDPLCLAIPEPQLGEAGDQPYLYYEVELVDWTGNYPSDDVVQTGFLTWNDVVGLLDPDDDDDWNEGDADYYHVQLNCGDDDGGGVVDPGEPAECAIEDADAGCTTAYLDGVEDGWIEIENPGDDLIGAYALFTDSTLDISTASVSVQLTNGVPHIIMSSQDGYQIQDYIIEVAQTSNDTESYVCAAENNIAAATEGDPDVEVDLASGISYPFYLRIEANSCSED